MESRIRDEHQCHQPDPRECKSHPQRCVGRYLFVTNWGEAVVEVVGGNDEEAEGDDNGVEEVVGVQDGILQRLACIRIS
jgi:hypothetical protein